MSHDPARVVEELRNILAAPDRRLLFLFGAGTSSAVNIAPDPPPGSKPAHKPLIPDIEKLTELCKTEVSTLGDLQEDAWETLVQQCKADKKQAEIEQILSRIRLKIDALSDEESLLGLSRSQLRAIEAKICQRIARAVSPAEESYPNRLPHDLFANWAKKASRSQPIEVFTTNYDMVLERSLEQARVPVFDGFVGTHCAFFYPECIGDESLLPPEKWLRLWKLHGSINWSQPDSPSNRLVRTQPSSQGQLILPSHRKYDESRKQPYLAYMDRLNRLLNTEDSYMVVSGYSFRDDHINEIIYNALDNRRTANVVGLLFNDLEPTSELAVAARQRPNLTLIAPNAAIVSGVTGDWQLTRPVDIKTHSFMDTAFDSNALPEEKDSPAALSDDLRGKMRLGDFNWFCEFLTSLEPLDR